MLWRRPPHSGGPMVKKRGRALPKTAGALASQCIGGPSRKQQRSWRS